jgi:hypothetical protein
VKDMLKSDYQWSDKELSKFYCKIATKRPTDINRGGGIYFYKNIKEKDILNGEVGLHVIYAYQKRFEEKNMFSHAAVLKKVLFGARWEIIRTRKALFIPNAKIGEELVHKRLNRGLRDICNMFDSILAEKPSESARYFFGM